MAALATAAASFLRTDPLVLVFTRDLPVGATVTEEDVRLAPAPAHLIPATALYNPDDAQGRVVVTATGAGEMVTSQRVTGAPLLEGLSPHFPPGTAITVVPVRLADPDTVAHLRHGDRVTIVTSAPDTGEPVVVASGGRVVVADPENPTTVLIALAEEEAQNVAAVSLASPLGVVLSPED